MNSNKTGYPHIDKPWMKYYDNDRIKEYENNIPCETLVEYLKEKNKGLEENIAISYYGQEITYKSFYEKINEASKALLYLGVKENDRVLYLMPNIPQTASLFYGTSQIGAIADYIDPRPESLNLKTSSEKLLKMINNEKINYIVSLNQCYLGLLKSIEEELRKININNIVIVNPDKFMDGTAKRNYLKEIINFEGLNMFIKTIRKSKKIEENMKQAYKETKIKLIDFYDLLELGKNEQLKKVSYNPNRIEVIVHTSGTTSSMPKAIPLTTDNLNRYVHQTFYSNMPMNKEDKALHILPYFAAFGISNVVHSGLCHNNNLIQIPEFAPKNLGKLILKYKPQTIIGAPSWLLNIMNDKKIKNKDLSFITMITYGGDSMSAYDEKIFNEFLIQHNCKCKVTKGHGMSEISGCGTYSTNKYNELNSMGIPLCGTTYAIVTPETNDLIKFENKNYIDGEIIISSPSASPGNLDNNFTVNHVIIDGIDFIKTGDIGRMYKNGRISFLSRNSRMFTRFDGYKIQPHIIENIIKENKRVKECIIVPYYEKEYFGNMPKAIIILKNNKDITFEEQTTIVQEIIDKQFLNNSKISSRQIPTKFEFVKELPIHKRSSKVNYKEIEGKELTGNEITVKIEETNLNLENITVIKPKTK